MKKFVKLLSAAALLICAGSTSLWAQTVEDTLDDVANTNSAIGISMTYEISDIDFVTGGLEYQHWFTDSLGGRVSFLGSYNPGESYSPSIINFNCEFDYMLFKSKFNESSMTKFYAWAMTGYIGNSTTVYNEGEYTKTFSNNAIAGFGFTLEYIYFKHVSTPFTFGFMGRFPDVSFGPCIGSGIRYTF